MEKEISDPPEDILSALVELKSVHGRLRIFEENLLFFASDEKGYCRWIELNRNKKGPEAGLICVPLDVSGLMKLYVYDRFRTIIATSATLTVDRSFEYFKERVGLSLVREERLFSLKLDSPFDYRRNALVCVPSDFPDPDDPAFEDSLKSLIRSVVRLPRCGGTFVLFTSYRLLQSVYRDLQAYSRDQGVQPLAQGEESRRFLLERFVSVRPSILFATDSFWQGVDIRGSALECVMIARLPFRVPTDPVVQARAEAMRLKGRDPFRHYLVPQAVMRFRQGFGRLIRSKKDRGAVLILDRRVLSRGYGGIFLNSLPDLEVREESSDRIAQLMEEFFGG